MLFFIRNEVSLNMKKLNFVLSCLGVFLIVCFIGCRSAGDKKAEYGEGTVVYKITYPDSMNYGMKSAFFPKEIVLIFKNEKAAFIASGGMGMIQMVNLLDHQNKKYVSLLIDQLRANFGCKLTPEEIASNENSEKLDFSETKDTKIIAGVTCNKAIAKNPDTGTQTEIYYDKNIKFSYGNSPFHAMDFLFLEYTHTINHLTMKLEATSVDLTTPVDTGLFQIRGDYIWVSQQQLFDRLNQL